NLYLKFTGGSGYLFNINWFKFNKTVSSVQEITVPSETGLMQNYPNPFNPITTIQFSVPDNGKNELVTLIIYDMLGREVTTVTNGKKESGIYTVQWNASGLSSGIYFYTLRGGEFINTKKLTLLK
ncbi:MAG TPA: hypothetical protein DCQ28_10485, partial [Bacteroidetes bacterium]|nr:hypothetical protein [Bacteroidota bacterium]